MEKTVCKKCGQILRQHGKFKFIYYCNNKACKLYKSLIVKRD